jgi:hypothetical protein
VVQRPAKILTSGRKSTAVFSRNTLFHKHPLAGVLTLSNFSKVMLHEEALLIPHLVNPTSRTPAYDPNYLPTVISLRLGSNIHGHNPPNLDIIAISGIHQDIRNRRMLTVSTVTTHIHAQTVAYQ